MIFPSLIKNIAGPDEISASIKKDLTLDVLKSNTHIHLPPNFSAFKSTRQAVERAEKEEIPILGVSNYYDFEVYKDFAELCSGHRIFPLFGIEIICMIDGLSRQGIRINDPANPGKFYICGKGISRFNELTAKAATILSEIRKNDSGRISEMVEKTGDLLKNYIPDLRLHNDGIKEMIVKRHGCEIDTVYLQERHIAMAYQEAIFSKLKPSQRDAFVKRVFGSIKEIDTTNPVAFQNMIRSCLMKAEKPAYVEEKFIDFDKAWNLIIELGGIPCYPVLADGVLPICEYETPVDSLIDNLHNLGIHAVEFVPVRNDINTLCQYVRAIRKAGYIVTAGTEHNILEMLPLELFCANNISIPDDIQEIFYEGTCVIAAHQFMNLHDRCGFVDNQGRPAPGFSDVDERIRAYSIMGNEIIHRYLTQRNYIERHK